MPLLPTTTPTTPPVGIGVISDGNDVGFPKLNVGYGGGYQIPVKHVYPKQIMGLIPCVPCNATECRQPLIICCPVNPVFGNVSGGQAVKTSTYENDLSTFMFDYGLAGSNRNATITFTLQKCESDGKTWTNKATLNSSTYGKYYPLNGFPTHLTYSGYTINWGKVYVGFGVGCYRLLVETKLGGAGGGNSAVDTCMASYTFSLKLFNCNLAHLTTKFEIWKTAKMGDVDVDGHVFDLCSVNLYDSLRCLGYFGEREIESYDTVLHEYENENTVTIHDMAVPLYKWRSGMIPYWMHLRISAYIVMADTTLISDYNINNSAYDIKQRKIIKKGAYKPNYFDKDWNQLQKVDVDFNLGYRGIISSSCCDSQKSGGK